MTKPSPPPLALSGNPLSAPSAAPPIPLGPVPAAAAPAANPEMSAAAGGMPEELQQQLHELEQWAVANRDDARTDSIAFWSLKVPAIFASASAGVWAHFELTTVSLLAGAVAGACVIVDGVHPRGIADSYNKCNS
ncbi:MAG: hypothetical protein ABI619_08310 [Betaproteobacteria bacterium]